MTFSQKGPNVNGFVNHVLHKMWESLHTGGYQQAIMGRFGFGTNMIWRGIGATRFHSQFLRLKGQGHIANIPSQP